MKRTSFDSLDKVATAPLWFTYSFASKLRNPSPVPEVWVNAALPVPRVVEFAGWMLEGPVLLLELVASGDEFPLPP